MDQLELGLADRALGAVRALDAKAAWVDRAEGWIVSHLRHSRFTADDLIAACGTPTSVGVNANNAIGALFLACSNRKLIHAVGRVASRRRTNHGRFITVWERL